AAGPVPVVGECVLGPGPHEGWYPQYDREVPEPAAGEHDPPAGDEHARQEDPQQDRRARGPVENGVDDDEKQEGQEQRPEAVSRRRGVSPPRAPLGGPPPGPGNPPPRGAPPGAKGGGPPRWGPPRWYPP